jgi:hypothetical protein
MGGTNEKIVPPAKKKAEGKEVQIGGNLRLHENAGEVHFHDDTAKVKVAISTPDFYKKWREWKVSPTQPLIFIDPAKQTKLTLEPVTVGDERNPTLARCTSSYR